MNDYALGEFLSAIFLPSVPAIAGGVIVFTLALLVYVAFRDGLMKEVSP
jgi:hypothetical protein